MTAVSPKTPPRVPTSTEGMKKGGIARKVTAKKTVKKKAK